LVGFETKQIQTTITISPKNIYCAVVKVRRDMKQSESKHLCFCNLGRSEPGATYVYMNMHRYMMLIMVNEDPLEVTVRVYTTVRSRFPNASRAYFVQSGFVLLKDLPLRLDFQVQTRITKQSRQHAWFCCTNQSDNVQVRTPNNTSWRNPQQND